MGWSAGFTFDTLGGAGMFGGSRRDTAAMADCVSCAAASILRSSTNCMVMPTLPRTLDDDMESRPGTVENCRSRIVATEAAMVSGLAPGSWPAPGGRKVDVRKIAHRQRTVAHDAEQHQAGHHRTPS
jgi:hypothetical protein